MAGSGSASPPLDYSFSNLHSIEDLIGQRPRRGLKRYRRTESGRYACQAWRLNNNLMRSLDGIQTIAYELVERPEAITWLDLSFNKIDVMIPEILAFTGLKILYLHGNRLSDLKSTLRILKHFDNLYNLTLHGNPLELVAGYRQQVLKNLISLRSLDFTNITTSDRRK